MLKKDSVRGAGILLHISSLPSNYGIGSFGKEARKFIDFLELAGQIYWQILPLGHTGYGDSPYQPFSAFAGNPLFIDLDYLVVQNLLFEAELEQCNKIDNEEMVDYEALNKSRYEILGLAYNRSDHRNTETYYSFINLNRFWLDDYALFMSLKKLFNNTSWQTWDFQFKHRDEDVLDKYKKLLQNDIEFYKFIQYVFFSQWNNLKIYANKKNISIIGDLPIYVSMDSSDAWSNNELFEFDENKNPIRVAGVPPDYFSSTGQLWGNPLYNWDYIEKTDFVWWKERMKNSAILYDYIRIDHFIGIERFYAIPAKAKDAREGKYEKGPSFKLINAIHEACPDIKIIAENLGKMTPEVEKLLEKTGYPGMKVLLFAFDGSNDNDHLPYNYTKNNIVYTGTHDNDTIIGHFSKNVESYKNALEYIGETSTSNFPWELIRLAYASVADIAIIPLQDFLELSCEGRMNTPSTLGCNWKWRAQKEELSLALANKIFNLTKIYGRLSQRANIQLNNPNSSSL